ncbi:unnamed protein product [Cuscuta epithymum]|uniref:Uncharacterized protein n=1 Tax=Cuscuta epithymum TaxID=186058 RepID=A0AAV0CP31_9ASTE|nr:unnamed protein product [Cuscuta epithymum]
MGSLTPGWDSLVSDPKAVKYKRNKSLTKEEINSYWRSKKEQKDKKEMEKEEDNHYHPSSSSSGQLLNEIQEGIVVDPADSQTSLDKLTQTHGWWVKSNWAHLNEPPPPEEAVHRCVSQFHVPNKASAATSDSSSSNHLHARISS